MKCPGQDSRYWKPGAIFEAKCPECGNEVEFFKDDTTRKCKKCGHRFLNPGLDFGCAAYCKYAEQCIGNLPPELIAQKEDLLKDRVAIEMKRHFKKDFKRIGHASRVARYAEEIGKKEQGNLPVILVAAYLHDIGIQDAQDHESEGPPVARDILKGLGAQETLIDEVCDIISHHHHPKAGDSIDFKCVYDADLIANLEERQKEDPMATEELTRTIEASFLTDGGQTLATQRLLAAS
ncbi:MAG: HD domain-containing protein [Deltaproteobacteria bacterium]|nr:HD domain-containing protein [Deltaproteobacteria bacterium]